MTLAHSASGKMSAEKLPGSRGLPNALKMTNNLAWSLLNAGPRERRRGTAVIKQFLPRKILLPILSQTFLVWFTAIFFTHVHYTH